MYIPRVQHNLQKSKVLSPIVTSENRKLSWNRSITEIWSRDAGTFYCNECLWRTINAIRSKNVGAPSKFSSGEIPGMLLPALFVHLPSPNVVSVSDVVQAVASLAAAVLVDQDDGVYY